MPSGRDSFRRNRVAPIRYDSLRPYYITRPKRRVATGDSAATIGYLLAVVVFSERVPSLADAAGNHQRFAGNPGRFSGSQKNRGRRNILWLPNSSERGLRLKGLAKIAFVETHGMHALGFH